MSDYGVTDAGFKRKRLNVLLEEINAKHKGIFGDNFNVSPSSPDGQINAILAESFSELWALAEVAYNAFNPSGVSGNGLSNLVQLNRIKRRAAVATRIPQIDITGTSGTTIPAGSAVSTEDGISATIDDEVTIGAGGTATATATLEDTGPIEVLADTMTNIDSPITGWDTVNNPVDGVIGTNEETDPELRSRRARSTAINAKAIIDAMQANILEVDSVLNAVILENITNSVDANGLPPKSFRAVVLGGVGSDIAQVIFETAPTGIESDGTSSEVITDDSGFNHTIKYQRPTEVPIYMAMEITPLSDFPVDGDDLIKQAIVDYANGDLVDGKSFSLGDDIIYSELYVPINTVPGVSVSTLYVNKTGAPGVGDTSDIAIDVDEISTFDTANISVTVL